MAYNITPGAVSTRIRRVPRLLATGDRAQAIMRMSQGGGPFYGHPAAFAVYDSARVRFLTLHRRLP